MEQKKKNGLMLALIYLVVFVAYNLVVFLVFKNFNAVFWISYELYRKGRFSEVFYAGLPNAKERRSVLEQYITGSLRCSPSDELLDKLVDMTDRYSYADIETAIKEVAQQILIQGKNTIDAGLLVDSIESIIPISTINNEFVSEIEEWGKERAINVSI